MPCRIMVGLFFFQILFHLSVKRTIVLQLRFHNSYGTFFFVVVVAINHLKFTTKMGPDGNMKTFCQQLKSNDQVISFDELPLSAS